MYLVFDVETHDKPRNWRGDVKDVDNWPHIVQIAWQLCDSDGACVSSHDTLVCPDGFSIAPGAFATHGISQEQALREGQELRTVLREFVIAVSQASTLVAHNTSFDVAVVHAELCRCGIECDLLSLPCVCTMRGSTEYCRLPGAYGYKWPKLEELHEKLFGSGLEGAHDAFVDVDACRRCFFALCEIGVLQKH